jgi:hypothetical protein
MFSRGKKKQETYTEGSNVTLSQSEIRDILRTVPRSEAFFFYEGIGKPIDHIATSLPDFLNKIDAVQSSSLAFHLRRQDFENWIRETIGDSELAKRIGKISSDDFNLKMKLYATINTRINELREMLSTSTVISEDFIATPRFSEAELSD